MDRNFSLSFNCLYVKGPFYSSRSTTWDETFHCLSIVFMSRDHSTVCVVRHGTKLFTVFQLSLCQGTILQLAQYDMGRNFSLSFNCLYVKGPFYSLRSPTWNKTFHCLSIVFMSRDHSTARAVRHGTKLFTVIKFCVCQGTILQLAQSDMDKTFHCL